ncbi:type III-A CRISPR-associated RAMP protein Csm3 [Paraflavitalea speifideaquila]|uniref:type III-A CRISPR-associated RAMP protein Csm3 n=1 Tax=Paraflavitalea speifideaquila TaxID=3076558 RepID=UPI0028EEAC37|nr:type III-A CRISPR-associated RAMP protein Csm3 [Paraflavitalea speifideiaquila]
MHIGGSKSSMDIGGLDSPVIKTPQGVPYIPGSSLKGKIRSLLAKHTKGTESPIEEDEPIIMKLFGFHGKNEPPIKPVISRLIFRDAYLDVEHFNKEFENAILDTNFTQEKYENTIDRKSGKAANGGLRNIERVPAGAKFNFEIVLDVYDDDDEGVNLYEYLLKGISLLNDDYLGGSGTRGYGKINMEYIEPETKTYS